MNHQADRHAGLVGFGVLQMAVGAVCAAMVRQWAPALSEDAKIGGSREGAKT